METITEKNNKIIDIQKNNLKLSNDCQHIKDSIKLDIEEI